jgi:hypothetical protein
MKPVDRIAVVYGVSALGAAAVSYLRGRRGGTLFADAALHGAIVGTGINAYFYLAEENDEIEDALGRPNPVSSFASDEDRAMKTPQLSHEAITLLGKIDRKVLTPVKQAGVTIGPLPENPSVIVQDPT